MADLYYNTLPLSVFMFSTSFCSSCLCSPEAFCFLKADYFVVNIMVLTPETVLRPSLLTTGCFLPLFSQQTGKLFGFFMHKDLVFCRQITGEFEELLLSLIDGLILWLVLVLLWPGGSWCSGSSGFLHNAAPTSQSSVLALTREGKTGSLWRYCCSEILIFWSNPAPQLSKCPALCCQSHS